MIVLLCGARGFLGRHLRVRLESAGHQVISGVRQPNNQAQTREIAIDYANDTDVSVWERRLRDLGQVDAVINAVGILNESADARFDDIHRDAPIALFEAARRCGVAAIVQISALGGAHEGQPQRDATPYLQTKRAADACLMQSPCAHLILRPSLVVGPDGDSSRLFRTLASLPVIGLPGNGQQQLQPVHITDVCEAVALWLADAQRSSQVIDAVGPKAMTYKTMLATYRAAMGLAQPLYVPIPMQLMRLTATLATYLPQKVLAPDTLRMLEQDNIADAGPFEKHLGHAATGSERWFTGLSPSMLAAEAIAGWSAPLFRLVLALLWIITGLLSLGIYPVQSSLQLLAAVGLHGAAAFGALLGAALLDIGMGVATLLRPGRRLWLAQIVLILGYSLVIALALPEFLLHPFGPVLKNLPVFAVLVQLIAGEKRT